MNKVYGIVCLSLAAAIMQAGPKHNLDQITEAINGSDIAQVKTQWRRLDSIIESSTEKMTILESLIKVASKLAEDSKGTTASGVGAASKDYKKVAGGIALFFASLGFGIYDTLHNGHPILRMISDDLPTSERLKALATYSLFIGGSYLSGKLMRVGLGWEGAEPIAGGGRSKATIVLSYLEGLLHELQQETRKA